MHTERNKNMATIRDSIIAAASAVKGETVEAGPTITDALDALTDALAGENVDSAPLIADEFAIMAQYLNSGSGMDLGRVGTVSLKVNDSYEELVTYVPCVYQNGPAITYINIDPDLGEAKFAQGVYVMGIVEGFTPTACTYKVGDSGTPQQGDIFVWTTWNMPAFGFVMPDATESDLNTFIEITAESATEPNPGNVTPA